MKEETKVDVFDGEVLAEDVPTYLFSTGLLGEINRAVLHPLGMELSITYAQGAGTMEIGPLRVCNVPGGLLFSNADLLEFAKKYEAAFPAREVGATIQYRQEKYGTYLQSRRKVIREQKRKGTPK